MKLALYSDLHREYLTVNSAFELSPLDVDVVILAGDIGSRTHGLEWAAKAFSQWPSKPLVVYVAGNHEYYDAHLGLLNELREPKWKAAGIHFLEQGTLELAGVRILGCTLWSAFDLHGVDLIESSMAIARRNINDYWMIHGYDGKRLEPSDTRALHKQAVQWLENELAKPFDGKTIIVTHFAPHKRCVAQQHQGSDVSPYFVTDMSALLEKHPIAVWCYGHTHTNADFIAENGCRVISNQRGYTKEFSAGNMGFRAKLVIEI